ncbi:cytochrome P450 [Paenibacillus sp. GYB004]|uniref:cytochrome P450 n=1 Tax=Paenibacillus sp. GYB004 TaxID=2994393 RepID=UPI002F9628F4
MNNNKGASPLAELQGPRPALGWRMNMLHFFRSPFRFQRQLYEQYGDLVSLGTTDKPKTIFAFGPELNRQVVANPDYFEMSTALVKIPKDTVMGQMFYNNLILMAGEKHKQHRRLIQPSFHHEQIVQYSKDMILLTEQLCDEWQHKQEIDVNAEMKKITQRIAVKTLMGTYKDKDLDQIGELISQLTKSLLWVTLTPVDIPYTPYHRALRIAGQLNDYIRSMIDQKRTEPHAADVLASLVKAHDEDGAKLNDEELVGHTFTLFVAGHETTANALTWTIFLLNQHPNVLSNLIEELDGAVQQGTVSMDKINKLPLLEGVIKESLRLLPPASIGTRVTAVPCELNGITIPASTNVFFSQFITHRIPELYSEPNRFKPERWLDFKPSPFEYLPFSTGPHMCVGWYFAMVELKIVLSILLRRYRIGITRNAKISPNLMMRPVHGMPARRVKQDRAFVREPVRGTINELVDF